MGVEKITWGKNILTDKPYLTIDLGGYSKRIVALIGSNSAETGSPSSLETQRGSILFFQFSAYRKKNV